MIKVSVIIPVYKVPLEYLRECFNSLAKQTLQNCEFLIVSDGAPEPECLVCEEYSHQDKRFKFFRQEHTGVSATRNYGIRQASGEYITFVDSDDFIDQHTCKQIYDFAKINDSDIVLWEAQRIYQGAPTNTPLYESSKSNLSKEDIEDLYKNIVYTVNPRFYSAALVCCKLFKRSLILDNNITYPIDISFSEDRIFNINAYIHAKRISYVSATLYCYRIHSQSTSRSYTENAFFVYTKFFSKLDEEFTKKYKNSISMEYIRLFFLSWSTYYLHTQNKDSLKKRTRDLKLIANSFEFQTMARNCIPQQLPLSLRLELFFLKRHIFIPLYLHVTKAEIQKLIKL